MCMCVCMFEENFQEQILLFPHCGSLRCISHSQVYQQEALLMRSLTSPERGFLCQHHIIKHLDCFIPIFKNVNKMADFCSKHLQFRSPSERQVQQIQTDTPQCHSAWCLGMQWPCRAPPRWGIKEHILSGGNEAVDHCFALYSRGGRKLPCFLSS